MRTAARSLVLAAVTCVSSPAFAQPAAAAEPLPSLPGPTAAPAPAATPVAPLPAPAATSTVAPAPADVPSTEPMAVPHRHEGFYLRSTSGFGYLSLSGDGPSGSASVSGGASQSSFAIGGTIARGLALAGSIRAGTLTSAFNGGPFAPSSQATIVRTTGVISAGASPNATASLAELGLLGDWYPDPTGGWHVGGLVGLGAVSVSNLADGSNWGGVTVGGAVFGGYDWWIGRSWSLGLMLAAAGMGKPTLNDSNRNDTGYRMYPLSIGAEASILYY